MSISREKVYAAIDSERDYQDRKWGHTGSSGQAGDGSRTLDEFIMYIDGYTRDLVDYASHESNAAEKLKRLRKVAGLCVAAMEQHGALKR